MIGKDINSFLVFTIAKEEYAVNASRIQRILEMQEITTIPHTPNFIKGIINLQDKPLTIINTRTKMGLPEIENSSTTCIVVIELYCNNEIIETGIVVDAVQSVIEFNNNSIQEAPNFSMDVNTDFIEGVVPHNNKFIIVLNVDAVFTSEEITTLKGAVSEQQIAE